jgi:hypothetical protein
MYPHRAVSRKSAGGAIISIPGALASSDNPQSGLSRILSFLATGKSISDAKSVGGDLSDLLKGGTDAVTDFTKVYNELSQSSTERLELPARRCRSQPARL